jgi:hypothetical protein
MALDGMAVDNHASEIYSGGLRMLTPIEHDELNQYEAVIQKGIETFVEVGIALMAIRDRALYEGGYGTFEEYCRQRWGFGKSYAYSLMGATKVIENLSTIMDTLPANLEQAKPLTQLKTSEQQQQAWERAMETAPDGRVTGLHVQSVVNEMLGKEPPQPRFSPRPTQDNSTGYSQSWSPSTRSEYDPIEKPIPFAPQTENQIRPNLQPLMTSDSPEWYTPDEIIERTIQVLGDIDLDPCSNSHEVPNVPASVHYTQRDNGLSKDWQGKTYLNPPYGREIKEWVAKLVESYELGDVEEAIALLPARTDTTWMRMLSDYPRCFVWGRLNLSENDNIAPFPSVVVYLGKNISRFAAAFSDIGDIYVKWRG